MDGLMDGLVSRLWFVERIGMQSLDYHLDPWIDV